MKGKVTKVEIVVLLKQVPATESLIGIAADGVSIKRDDIKWVINPYDEFAVEEALRIKEAHGGSVSILSVGSEKTVEAIRTALAMGADKGILINVPDADIYDGLTTAKLLSAALKEIPFDIIIAGQRFKGPVVTCNVQLPAGKPQLGKYIRTDIYSGYAPGFQYKPVRDGRLHFDGVICDFHALIFRSGTNQTYRRGIFRQIASFNGHPGAVNLPNITEIGPDGFRPVTGQVEIILLKTGIGVAADNFYANGRVAGQIFTDQI